MKTFALAASIAVALTGAASIYAQAPVLTHVIPAGIAPGSTVDITLHGQNLASPTALWTSFGSTYSFGSSASSAVSSAAGTGNTTAHFRVTLPKDAMVGVGGLRVATRNDVSDLRLIMIDDLPSTVDAGNNKSPASAQAIVPPIAVDGTCDKEQSDFYKFHAVSGQRFTLEVVARRLGFRTDAVVRLLDSSGRELAYADDDLSAGADPRLAYRFSREGDYFVELRDVRYEGGPDFRYRLRLGEFPLPSTAFPLALRRGVTTSVALSGLEGAPTSTLSTLIAPDSELTQVRLPAIYAAGRGSSWVTLQASDGPEQIEQEPNDVPAGSTACAIPGAVQGRLQVPGDRDFYHFEAKKGQRLIFRGQARSFGSPADLYLRIYKADGSVAMEVDDQGTDEGTLNFKAPLDGVYRLMVEHVTGGGGPEHAYRVLVEPFEPRFDLTVAPDKFHAPQLGVFAVKVVCQRREYDGPIELSLEGGRPGYVLKDNVIGEKKPETKMVVTLPRSLRAGQIETFKIVGKATAPGAHLHTVASTIGALRTKVAGLAYPPPELDGVLALGVGPEFPPFFAINASPATIYISPSTRTCSIRVKATREKGFEDTIRLAIEGLSDGLTAKIPSIEKGQKEVLIALTAASPLGAKHSLQIIGTATHKDQPGRSRAKPIEIVPGPSIEVALAPMGKLSPGGKQKAVLSIRGDVESLVSGAAEYEPGVSQAADGPRPPEFAGLEADNRAAGFSGADKSPADDHLAAVLDGLSGSDYSVELFLMPARDLSLPGAPQISGYIFSRPGASAVGGTATGDHLGIGGLAPVAPRDKLFVYNGRDVLAGKTTLALNAWHHVVMVRSGESVIVYLNGEIATPEIQAPLAKASLGPRVTVGTRSDGFGPLQGKLDEVSVFARQLSPQQVKTHYDAARTPGGYSAAVLKDQPLALWRLNETGTNRAQNAAGHKLVLHWKNLPAGVTGPLEVALPLGQQQVELELAAAPDAAVGRFDKVAVAAAVPLGAGELNIESSPTVFEIVKSP